MASESLKDYLRGELTIQDMVSLATVTTRFLYPHVEKMVALRSAPKPLKFYYFSFTKTSYAQHCNQLSIQLSCRHFLF